MLEVRDINMMAETLVFDSWREDSEISQEDRIFAINAISAYEHALAKDGPAKVWWKCPITHPSVYRALQIPAASDGAVYACSPFRLSRTEKGPRILAAYPAPRDLDEPDCDWLCIHTVISWNPVDDTGEVLGDPSPQIVGNLSDATNVIFASPRAFLQHWARRRGQYLARRAQAKANHWNKAPIEEDETPGVLMIGAPAEIRWRPSEMPADIQCAGVNPAVINRELLKAARVPRARGSAT